MLDRKCVCECVFCSVLDSSGRGCGHVGGFDEEIGSYGCHEPYTSGKYHFANTTKCNCCSNGNKTKWITWMRMNITESMAKLNYSCYCFWLFPTIANKNGFVVRILPFPASSYSFKTRNYMLHQILLFMSRKSKIINNTYIHIVSVVVLESRYIQRTHKITNKVLTQAICVAVYSSTCRIIRK